MDKKPKQNSMVPNSFQTPNLLVDRLLPLLLDNELRVVLFAYRHTLGWSDRISARAERLSLSAFEHGHRGLPGCGLARPAIVKALKSLAQHGVLQKVGEPTHEGQLWRVPDDEDEIDWDGLEERQRELDEKRRRRTAKATRASRKKRAANSPRLPLVRQTYQAAGTPDVPAKEYAPRTGSGTSHVPPGSTPDVPESGTPDVPIETHEEIHPEKPILETHHHQPSDDSDFSDAPDTPPAPVDDDDWKFIQPEIDKLGLGQKALAALCQRDPATALALVWYVLERATKNPGGLLVTMLRDGQNPPADMLMLAADAIQFRALDPETLARKKRVREAERFNTLGPLAGAVQPPHEASEPAAVVETLAPHLETFPDGTGLDSAPIAQKREDTPSAPGETQPHPTDEPPTDIWQTRTAGGLTWEKVWLHVLALMEKLSPDIRARFGEPDVVSFINGVLTIQVTSGEAEFLNEHLGPIIETEATRVAGEFARMQFVDTPPEQDGPVTVAIRWTEASGWRDETPLVLSCAVDDAAGQATLMLDFAALDRRARYGWTALNELPPVRITGDEGHEYTGTVESVSRVPGLPGGAKVIVRLDETAEDDQASEASRPAADDSQAEPAEEPSADDDQPAPVAAGAA